MRASIRSTPFGHGAPEGSGREFGQLLGVAGRRPSRGLCRRLLERQLGASSPALLRVPLQSLGSTAALPVVYPQAGKLLCVYQSCVQLGVEGDASLGMHKHPIDSSMASWRSPTRRRHVYRRRRSLTAKQHGRRNVRALRSSFLCSQADGARRCPGRTAYAAGQGCLHAISTTRDCPIRASHFRPLHEEAKHDAGAFLREASAQKT